MADNNRMSIFEKLSRFVCEVFKTTMEIFLEALKASPNAQGYVIGSITELLLKKKLETDYGFEVKRIREKWEGRKHSKHHGDYYFRKPGTNLWFVMESKGVKSNSEKWHKLYNHDALKRFLINHADKIPWIDGQNDAERQISDWLHLNLPKFENEYAGNLYEYEEVQRYLENMPKRETLKSQSITRLRDYNRDQTDAMIEERLNYVMSKVKVLETHFVSGTSGVSERTQATPRKDEFNAISIDIVLRYPEHKFLFANPKHLESSSDDPNHLQQNYIMGFVFTDNLGSQMLSISEEWYDDFNQVYETISPDDAIDERDMQIDNRNVIVDNNGQ
jgi:hypothetical protein